MGIADAALGLIVGRALERGHIARLRGKSTDITCLHGTPLLRGPMPPRETSVKLKAPCRPCVDLGPAAPKWPSARAKDPGYAYAGNLGGPAGPKFSVEDFDLYRQGTRVGPGRRQGRSLPA